MQASCLHSIQELDCSTVCSTPSTLPPDEPLQIWSSAFKKCFCVIRFKPHYTVTVLKSHTISQKEKCECINAVLVDMAFLLALAIVFDNNFWIPIPSAIWAMIDLFCELKGLIVKGGTSLWVGIFSPKCGNLTIKKTALWYDWYMTDMSLTYQCNMIYYYTITHFK